MSHKLSTLFSSALLLFFLSLPLAGLVRAQSSLTAIPPKYELTLNPGETQTVELKLKNETDSLENYTIAVTDFIVNDESGTPIPITTQTDNRYALSAWVKAPDLIPVDAGATSPILLTVTAPANARPGGHYAMITYQPRSGLSKEDLAKSGSIVGQRTGTLLYVTVPGNITEKALITQFSAPLFSEYGPVPVNLTIENASDIHITPKGQLVATNLLNHPVANPTLPSHNIFPGQSKSYKFSIGSKWMVGRYQLAANIAYGTTGQSVSGLIYFWVFPWKLAIAILGGLIALIILILYLKHRQQNRKDEIETLKENLTDIEQTHDQTEQ